MSKPYQPSQFEDAIRTTWEKERVYRTNEELPQKEYILGMFPYPSGAGIHTGHARIYTATDVIARFLRMQGKAVLFPMGWDAFGLPAENAAIKLGVNPSDLTKEYIVNFKKQIQRLGLSYDWEKELSTCDPKYYALTQWLFIQFFKAGLLYKKNTEVYFCDACKTGLAQEEVLPDGTHERCGNLVTKKNLPQWIFRITKYADRLLLDLEGLEWPRGILEMQKNWIGKKTGMIIHHTIDGAEGYVLDTFTAYPAWSYADTFIVVAPEHPLVGSLLKGEIACPDRATIDTLTKYVEKTKSKSEVDRMADTKSKTGVFTGLYANDPFNLGAKMPIWVADFALMDFGTGAIRCSAHDVRDFEFAQKYNIPLKEVVLRVGNMPVNAHDNEGTLVDSGDFTGKKVDEVVDAFCNFSEQEGIGERKTTYHLRDWVFSRQRYWGEPIPMIYCGNCSNKKISFWEISKDSSENIYPNSPKMDQNISENWKEINESMYGWFPIDEKSLPLELPYLPKYEPTGTGESPLAKVDEWVKTTCPHCGGDAKRETDTMPNWAGSSWYFMAYPFWNQEDNAFDVRGELEQAAMTKWLPVSWYIGGAEHAVLHLLYARFWTKFLCDMGYVSFNEPFLKLESVGIVIAEDNRKMSKSLGNVVNPDTVVDEYGADTLRIYEMFMAPFSQEVAWSTKALQGSFRFIKRIWHLYNDSAKIVNDNQESDSLIAVELQNVIDKITKDIPDVKFNTSIAAMMKFINTWEAGGSLNRQDAKKFLQVLAPFAPFIADHFWREIFNENQSIHLSRWPEVDTSLMQKTRIKVPIQVDGKVRDVIECEPGISQVEIERIARQSEKVSKFLTGSTSIRYIQDRILNFINKKS